MSDNKKIKQFKKRIDTDKERSLKLITAESEQIIDGGPYAFKNEYLIEVDMKKDCILMDEDDFHFKNVVDKNAPGYRNKVKLHAWSPSFYRFIKDLFGF